MKFHEKNDEIPPGACRPSKKLNKNNVQKVGPQKVETKQCAESSLYKHRRTHRSAVVAVLAVAVAAAVVAVVVCGIL